MTDDEKKGYIYDFDNLNKRISELEEEISKAWTYINAINNGNSARKNEIDELERKFNTLFLDCGKMDLNTRRIEKLEELNKKYTIPKGSEVIAVPFDWFTNTERQIEKLENARPQILTEMANLREETKELEKKVNDWINGQAILDERIEKLEEVVREFNKCLWRGGVITIEYKDRIEEKLEDDTKFGFTEWEKHNECIYVKRDDLEELLIERIDYTKAFNKFRKKYLGEEEECLKKY